MLNKIGANIITKKDKLVKKIEKRDRAKERNRCKICGGMKTDADRNQSRRPTAGMTPEDK